MTIFSRSPSRLMAPARMPFISWDSKTATGSSAPLSSRVSTRLSRSPRSEPVEDLVQLVGGDAELLGDLGVGGRLELELLPQPFHGRRLVQEAPPLAGRDCVGRSGVCYPARRAGGGRRPGSPRHLRRADAPARRRGGAARSRRG